MISLPTLKIAQGEPFAYQARVTGQSWVGYTGTAIFRPKRGSLQADPIVTIAVTGDATGLMTFSLTTAQTALFPALAGRGPQVTAQFEITMKSGADAKKYRGGVQVAETIAAG